MIYRASSLANSFLTWLCKAKEIFRTRQDMATSSAFWTFCAETVSDIACFPQKSYRFRKRWCWFVAWFDADWIFFCLRSTSVSLSSSPNYSLRLHKWFKKVKFISGVSERWEKNHFKLWGQSYSDRCLPRNSTKAIVFHSLPTTFMDCFEWPNH